MTIPQWTSEVPTKDGNYWLTYSNMRKPGIVSIYANYVRFDSRHTKLATFAKKQPEALWCEVIPPPPIPATNGDSK